MKQPKKLTRDLKEQLDRMGLDPIDYVIVSETNDEYIVQKKKDLKTENNKIVFDK